MAKSIRPALSKIVSQLISDLFYNAIASLESANRTFSHQLAIKSCYEKLHHFLLTRPYSNFVVEVLGVNDSALLSLEFDNIPEIVEDMNQNQFVIEIAPTFTTFKVYMQGEDDSLTELML